MAKKRTKTLSDQLRDHIDNSGQTRYAICKATGIDQAALSRFMSGQRTLSMPNVDILAEYLGLRLISTERKQEHNG